MLKKLFNVEKTIGHKKITIFGIKFGVKEKLPPAAIEDLRAYVMASTVNSKLEKYRGIHYGKSILIVGGGSSLKHFKQPESTINIGINRAYKMDNVVFDYLFAQDNFPRQEEIEGFINYREDDCKKFLGIHTVDVDYRIRQSTIARIKNKELYILNNRRPDRCPQDITLEPFAYFTGTIFAALQFALFTNPDKIYLAGFDCNRSHNFDNNPELDLSYQYKSWLKFKKFMQTYHENTEIISINPVGLKGLFNDIYTQSYIDEHPELQNESIKIIERN